jgi:hypothetical protein
MQLKMAMSIRFYSKEKNIRIVWLNCFENDPIYLNLIIPKNITK